MAIIDDIKNKQGETVYPRTVMGAVYEKGTNKPLDDVLDAHTADKLKHISKEDRAYWNDKLDNADKGVANGVASLDGTKKIPKSQLPDIPIQDINGVEYRPVVERLLGNVSKMAESAVLGNNTRALVSDENFIYVAGIYNNKGVFKLKKSDLSLVAESISVNSIEALAIDENYIYVGSDVSTGRVWKLNKSDLSKVAESPSFPRYGKPINAVTIDDTFVYARMAGYIHKFNKTDMTLVAESINTRTTHNITSLGNYLYGVDGMDVLKINKSNLDIEQTTRFENISNIRFITNVDTTLYINDNNNNIRLVEPNDLSIIKGVTLEEGFNFVSNIYVYKGVIYFTARKVIHGSPTTYHLVRLCADSFKVLSMVEMDDSAIDYKLMYLDDDYIFVGVSNKLQVLRFSNFSDKYEIKHLVKVEG